MNVPRRNEAGAILPMVAILMIMLLSFAAFAVDLGAAWAERTQDQTAADAAALAAGIQYLHTGSPSSGETIETVIEYVAQNLTNDPTPEQWITCVDDAKPDTLYVPLTDEDTNITYDCISLRQEAGTASLLRVRIPDRNVPTSFARVMGIDSIAVSAAAIVELSYHPSASVLPFSLPMNPSPEECLGVPPNGQNSGDVIPCSGEFGTATISANFGLLDSPWFGTGTEEPHATGDSCIEGNPSYEERTEHNLAIGLDHIVKVFPYDPMPAANTEMRQAGYDEGFDECAAADAGEEPFILHTETGAEESSWAVLTNGMIGPGPYGALNEPGRLRQTGGLNDGTSATTIELDTGLRIDNIGLWEYLVPPAGGQYQGDCDFKDENGNDLVGRAATTRLIECITPGGEQPEFSEALLESPRYAVVPVLNYNDAQVNITGDSWHAIMDMVPVYIQSTWYGCSQSASTQADCLFQPDDFIDLADPYSGYHNPGESDTPPCSIGMGSGGSGTTCDAPQSVTLKGSSVIVLDWDWLPDCALNALGSGRPYQVHLYR